MDQVIGFYPREFYCLDNFSSFKVEFDGYLYSSLEQNPYVKKKLLETKDYLIVEDSPKDSYWGWGEDRNGENHLGKLWMKLRDELIK